jgi:hypothetical protein
MDGVELDVDEMRRLAGAGGGGGDRTIGTSPSMTIMIPPPARPSSSSGTVRGRGGGEPPKSIGGDGGPADFAAARSFRDAFLSPPFLRRLVFLGTCFVLMAAGVLLTVENFASVRTVEDWIEPSRSSSSASSSSSSSYASPGSDGADGGDDWMFGESRWSSSPPHPPPPLSVAGWMDPPHVEEDSPVFLREQREADGQQRL